MPKYRDFFVPNSNNTSGTRGVSFDKSSGKWVAKIGYGGARYYLGKYADRAMAEEAYAKMAAAIQSKADADRAEKDAQALSRVAALAQKLSE